LNDILHVHQESLCNDFKTDMSKLQEMLSLATAVVQLYMALPHSPTCWSLQHTGVACFTKDNPRRSYFIRLFDVKLTWEQELYNQMVYHSPRPFFHAFAADDCQVGLNFVNEQESETFLCAVEDKINQRNRQEVKVSIPNPIVRPGSPASPSVATIDIQNPDIQASRYRSVTPVPAPAFVSKGKKDKKKDKRKGSKLSKADIGAPSGFTHVSHVGWDPNNLDPDLKKLLSCAGISEAELKDEETSQLIQQVIENSGGMEAVKKAMHTGKVLYLPYQAAVPPLLLPLLHGGVAQAPCPLPQDSQGEDHPLPSPSITWSPATATPSSDRGGLPHPPPSVSYTPPPPPPGHQRSMPASPPPPPPPPPAQSSGDLPSPPHHFKGPPSPAPASTGGCEGGERGALLDQIRLGRKLKNVTDSPESPPPADTDSEGIVGALMMVMQKRSKVIHSSDEGEEEGGYDDEDDDEWDD
uniref:WASP actin nucleation promoting factor a n=1 Tax=Oncorhynchus tshawytscha TaxID=74940 RepID=A0AAZ3QW55_ONCTS